MSPTTRAVTLRATGVVLMIVFVIAGFTVARNSLTGIAPDPAPSASLLASPTRGPSTTPTAEPLLEGVDAADLDPAAKRYGPTGARCPADAIRVSPDEPSEALLDAAGSDDVVCFTAGRYRMTDALRPKQGMTLFFEQGAVLDGSVPVDNWEYDGTNWIADEQRQHFEPTDVPCEQNPVACAYEDLYVDGRPLRRVLELSELQPGTFYFDKPGDTIHLADDPTGHRVEATITETAIDAGGVHDVTVRNATIEKFAKHGIITSDGWTVRDNEIRYVHSHGLRAFGSTRVEGNYIHHAGNMGIFGEGDGLVFEDNQLAYNNALGFDLWHAGATKITESAGTVVRGNWSHHNTGDGWWFDWNNAGATVEGNVFEHNSRYGLFYEASFDARIMANAFLGNGSDDGTGAGLWITTSKNVEVGHNVFAGNHTWSLALVSTDRGVSERYGVRETVNLHVHDNAFTLADDRVGVAFGSTDVYASEANNRFTNNHYRVADVAGEWWRWGSADADEHWPHDWAGWNDAGQDVTGTITRAGN
jgi:hypothetical protein